MTSASKGTTSRENAMTAEELARFLAEPREARLGTVRRDGDVHLTPVWFAHEDGKLRFCLESARLHLKNLRRNPRATLLVDFDTRGAEGSKGTAAGAMFRGPVALVEDDAIVEPFRARLRRRYYGDDVDDQSFVQATSDFAFTYVLCELTPEQTLTWDFSKG